MVASSIIVSKKIFIFFFFIAAGYAKQLFKVRLTVSNLFQEWEMQQKDLSDSSTLKALLMAAKSKNTMRYQPGDLEQAAIKTDSLKLLPFFCFLSEAFIPLGWMQEESSTTKKQSVIIKRANLVEQVAAKYRWSVGEFINYAVELFLFAFMEINEDGDVFLESPCFQEIKTYAAKNKVSEAEVLRCAVEIFARLLREGIIDKALDVSLIQDGHRSLPGIFSDLLEQSLSLLNSDVDTDKKFAKTRSLKTDISQNKKTR